MIEQILSSKVSTAVKELYATDFPSNKVVFAKTNKEFEGDITLVVFPFVKLSKKTPEATAQELGEYLQKNVGEVEKFNVVKGFLNLVISKAFWLNYFNGILSDKNFGFTEVKKDSPQVMVEYSSPNTNKPLHLGHIRNNLLGFSVAQILSANGNEVIKVNLVNDRGIHICKSMLAWKKWGNGETPESSGMKGDHLVGKYYVEFDKHYKAEIAELKSKGIGEEEAEKKAPLIIEAQELLVKWEQGDKEVKALWEMMNSWVYKGFDESYKMLGVSFDKTYYESQTYLLGKKIVQEGLDKKVFYKKEDGSVRVDLSEFKLDEKVLLRSDGTSVYITQDLGTASERFKEFPQLTKLIYTVGNEQEHHFKVLFSTLKKLGYKQAEQCYHLSYGMVELPEGKMKSREGTVVDADDLIAEMIKTAKEASEQSGKQEGFTEEEKQKLYHTIALGALKYFILKVDPKKKMLFDPKESIDLNGNTGPFIQYTYTRISSVLRKVESLKSEVGSWKLNSIETKEKDVIKLLYDFPNVVKEAGVNYSPAVIANYTYELAKCYNQFYHDITILKEEDEQKKNFRLALSKTTGEVIKNAMMLLGIEVPERM